MAFPKFFSKELVISATKASQEALDSISKVEVQEVKLSKKAKHIARIINSGDNFGCQKKHVAKLMSILLDEKIEVAENAVSEFNYKEYISPFTALVLLDNPNSHHYPLNKPLIYKADDYLFNSDGNTKNHAPLEKISSWRLATIEEIESFFSKHDEETETGSSEE